MINKESLNSLISKYHLGGLNEATKWEVKNNLLTIRFMAPTTDMLGKIEFTNFPLEDTNIAVFNTTQLNKLLSVIQGNLLLEVTKNKSTAVRLNVSDSNFNVTYALASPDMIKDVATATEPSEYDVEINLEQDHINNLIKSKTAVGIDDDMLIIESNHDLDGNNILSFTFGENTEYSNKVTFSIPLKTPSSIKLPFPSKYFKEILVANKNMAEGKLSINGEGLIKLKFSDKKEITSEYFIVRKSDF